jgi:nucleoside-diphosphate-sugar epimerase
MRTCSLRLTNTYGPGQLIKHNRQGFTGTFIRMAVEGRPIQLYGTGEQKRDFSYVTDVVDALLRAGASERVDGTIMNLGSSEVHTLKRFVELLQEITKVKYQLVPFPDEIKKIDVGDFYSNFSLAQKVLGWNPKVPLREGLAATVDYYRKNLAHYTQP